MRCIIHYYEQGLKAINERSKKEDKISYALLKNQTGAQMAKLKKMKFEDPRGSKQELQGYFTDFVDEISSSFKNLLDKWLTLGIDCMCDLLLFMLLDKIIIFDL